MDGLSGGNANVGRRSLTLEPEPVRHRRCNRDMKRSPFAIGLAVLLIIGFSGPACYSSGLESSPRPITINVETGRVTIGSADSAWVADNSGAADAAVVSLNRSAGSTRVTIRAPGQASRSQVLAGRWRFPIPVEGESPQALTSDRSSILLERFGGSGRFAILPITLRAAPTYVDIGSNYTFDAVSGDGARLFLTEHRAGVEYAIRQYTVATAQLAAEPVVVKGERTAFMAGTPVARTSTPDGEWVFTLYERPGYAPFIHALNTQGFSHCIDLPLLPDAADAARSWALTTTPTGLVVLAANTAVGLLLRASGRGDGTKPRSEAIAVSAGRAVFAGPRAGGSTRAVLGTSLGLWAVEPTTLQTQALVRGVSVERLVLSGDGTTAVAVANGSVLAVDTTSGSRLSPTETTRRLGSRAVRG